MRPSTWILSVLLLTACSRGGADRGVTPPTNNPPTTPPNPPVTSTPVLSRSVVLQGLSEPWDIAFGPDGSMFFTEKCRGLSVRHPDGTVTRLFGTSGSALLADDLTCLSQSGMHGVALDPQFATNRTLYVYMLSTRNTSPRTNRVVRLVANATL